MYHHHKPLIADRLSEASHNSDIDFQKRKTISGVGDLDSKLFVERMREALNTWERR